jgi:hypothetical protein
MQRILVRKSLAKSEGIEQRKNHAPEVAESHLAMKQRKSRKITHLSTILNEASPARMGADVVTIENATIPSNWYRFKPYVLWIFALVYAVIGAVMNSAGFLRAN